MSPGQTTQDQLNDLFQYFHSYYDNKYLSELDINNLKKDLYL